MEEGVKRQNKVKVTGQSEEIRLCIKLIKLHGKKMWSGGIIRRILKA